MLLISFEELTEAISATIRAILYPNVAQVKPYDDLLLPFGLLKLK